jgi:hypothetical protein
MKKCPECNRTYADETFAFCLADGALLSASYDPHATQALPMSIKPDPGTVAKIDEPVVAININQQYKHAKSADDLYNATRGMWRVSRERAEKAKYAFAVYQGVIKEVYEIDRWIPASKETKGYWKERERAQGNDFSETHEGRSEFIGRVAPEEIRKKYVGRQLPVRQTQNPIRYLNC